MQLELLREVVTHNGTRGQSGKRRRQSTANAAGITCKALLALVESQNHRCALTGRELTPETAAVDHATPLSRGGAHAIENLQVLHRDVNQAKGTMTHEEFVQMCRDVIAWVDRQG